MFLSTTILSVRHKGRVAIGGDGQVTFNNTVLKRDAKKIRRFAGGEVIGILGLQETEEDRQWSPEEIALVETISEHFALAAENLRLIDATQQRAAHEKRVNEIGEKIQAAQSLEEALQIAVKEVGLSLRSPQTMVKLEVK